MGAWPPAQQTEGRRTPGQLHTTEKYSGAKGVCLCVCTLVRMFGYLGVCVCVFVCVCVYLSVCVCDVCTSCVYVFNSVCVCVCVCILALKQLIDNNLLLKAFAMNLVIASLSRAINSSLVGAALCTASRRQVGSRFMHAHSEL